MKICALLMLFVFVSLLACKKKQQLTQEITTPTPPVVVETGGRISASIKPAQLPVNVLLTALIKGQTVFFRTVSDNNGAFELANLPAGQYNLFFTLSTGVSLLVNNAVIVVDGKLTALGEIDMVGLTQGTLSGTIAPAEAVTKVTIVGTIDNKQLLFTTAPDAQGNFNFTQVPFGNYALHFDHSLNYLMPFSKSTTISAQQKNVNLGTIQFTNITDCGTAGGEVEMSAVATKVSLRRLDSYEFLELSPDPRTGKFSFPKVPKGSYSLNFTMVSGKLTPASTNIEITGGQHLDIGLVTFQVNEVVSKISCKLNGGAVSWQTMSIVNPSTIKASATYTDSKLTITGYNTYIDPNPGSGRSIPKRELVIKLVAVNGVGTYICDANSTSNVIYTESVNRYSSSATYHTYNGGSAKVVITEINTVSKVISGTFIATVYTSPGTTVLKREFTEGTFKVTYP